MKVLGYNIQSSEFLRRLVLRQDISTFRRTMLPPSSGWSNFRSVGILPQPRRPRLETSPLTASKLATTFKVCNAGVSIHGYAINCSSKNGAEGAGVTGVQNPPSKHMTRGKDTSSGRMPATLKYREIRGPLEKFVDSPYYSESELCGGTTTVSFSKYLPWQAMHFLQCSTHFSKTCCRQLIISKFLVPELHFHSWKSPEIAKGKIWIEFCVRLGKSGSVEPH
jgi:hypothetical protein